MAFFEKNVFTGFIFMSDFVLRAVPEPIAEKHGGTGAWVGHGKG